MIKLKIKQFVVSIKFKILGFIYRKLKKQGKKPRFELFI